MTAALYECRLIHRRSTPVRHEFGYRTYLHLVDLDDLPRLPWWLRPLAGFHARDHLGDPAGTIRSNVDAYVAGRGIELRGGHVYMLTQARVFGYVFNPITVFWCHDAAGGVACVLVEVHNTYGSRHCYLLRPDPAGRASTAKEFYVSPFFPVDGEYRMSLPEPDDRLSLTVVLERNGAPAFMATIRGQRLPLTAATLTRAAIRHPWSTAMVSARIRWQGIRLRLRGLPVQPRPHDPADAWSRKDAR